MNYGTDKQLFLEMMGMLNDTTYFCEQAIAGNTLNQAMMTTMHKRTKEARELHKRAQKFVKQQAADDDNNQRQHSSLRGGALK